MSVYALYLSHTTSAAGREDLEFTLDEFSIEGPRAPISLRMIGRIVNVSDISISISSITLENSGTPFYLGTDKLFLDGKKLDRWSYTGMGFTLEAGSSLPYRIEVELAAAPDVLAFGIDRDFQDAFSFLMALCNEEKINYHGRQLSEIEFEMCPAFHLFTSRHNWNLSGSNDPAFDVISISVETYRSNRFQSLEFRPEIGGSAL
jgi:hypothetical protein